MAKLMASKKTLNAKNLKALGARRLAELLIEISTGNTLVSRFRSSHDFRLLFSDFDCSEAEALDGAEDVIGGFGPFEGFGVLVCPNRDKDRPNRDRLALRFKRFKAAA